MEFIKEFWGFIRVRKKYWLLPLILSVLMIGGLMFLAKGSTVAPFIYTVF